MNKFIFLGAFLGALLLAGIAPAGEDTHARRFTLGQMEIIALADIPYNPNAPRNPELLIGIDTVAKEKTITGVDMATSINAFIVKLGGEVMLFDTGLGKQGGGKLLESMLVAGVRPEDVTAVMITHFHRDHIGGLVQSGGQPVFPNARLMVPRMEMEWGAREMSPAMAAYAGQFHMFEWDGYVANGVQALAAPGHTPGHSLFLLNDGQAQLLIMGDLIHFAMIQLPFPDVAVSYDKDPTGAIAARKQWFDEAAQKGYTVAGMHMVFPGVGKLTKQGTGYGFSAMK